MDLVSFSGIASICPSPVLPVLALHTDSSKSSLTQGNLALTLYWWMWPQYFLSIFSATWIRGVSEEKDPKRFAPRDSNPE